MLTEKCNVFFPDTLNNLLITLNLGQPIETIYYNKLNKGGRSFGSPHDFPNIKDQALTCEHPLVS